MKNKLLGFTALSLGYVIPAIYSYFSLAGVSSDTTKIAIGFPLVVTGIIMGRTLLKQTDAKMATVKDRNAVMLYSKAKTVTFTGIMVGIFMWLSVNSADIASTLSVFAIGQGASIIPNYAMNVEKENTD